MKTCALDGIDVAYEEFGEGRPILFLHGWTLDHACEVADFEPIFADRPGWQRLYLDLPGHGRTPGAQRVRNMDGILQVVLDFADALLPGQRFAVAGTSAGALPARGVVYHRFEQVCGLLIRIPMIVADDARRALPEPTVLVEDEAFMTSLSQEDREAYSDVLVQKADFVEPLREYLGRYIWPAQARGDAAFCDAIRPDPKRYGLSFDVDDLPQPFMGPSLILAGRQDTTVGYRDAWSIVEGYPRATFVVLDRYGHSPALQQAGLFGMLVRDWLDRVKEAESQRLA
ncbi:MAG: alpha/beta hydrolase [Chloroflexota bacterium]|jgi:pimeloyl-ACP methyl ester carboxylesterase